MLERLGKYELRGVLGKGAMGTVYDAWDPGIARRVAIKTIQLPSGQHTSGDENAEDAYARFKREAQAAGRLSHPGIVAVYDQGETDGVAYIVMELIEGQPLKALLDQEHRLAPDAAIRVMVGLLDALGYSHGCGVIHRDIKPTNIILTKSGAVKIADFGIARIENSEMTQVGTVMGTPAYMSPEQFMGQAVDARTDIYASGVVLYHLLTGEKPFQGGMTAIMHKVLHTDPPKPSELSVTAPPALDAVVAKAMARRPEDRYASARAFSDALTAAMRAPMPAPDAHEDRTTVLPRGAAPVSMPPVAKLPAPPAVQPGNRRWGAVIGGITLVIGLAAGAGWLVSRPTPPPVQTAMTPVPAPVPATPVLAPPEPAAPPEPVQPPMPAPTPESPKIVPPALVPPAFVPPAFVPPAPGIAKPDPAPVPPIVPAPVMAPVLAPIPPSALDAALAGVRCTDLETTIGPDQRIVVTGAAGGGGPEGAARVALDGMAGARAGSPIDWRAARFDGPYCPVVDLVRWIRAGAPPGFEFTLQGAGKPFRDRARVLPLITAPAFPAHLRLSYFQQNGSVDHLYPTGADPVWRPSSSVVFTGAESAGWSVGPPFGTDMILAVMSSVPLPSRPAAEPSETYLAVLRTAIEAARRGGATVLARVIVLQTQP